jgi:hypothetical protein
MLRDEPAERGPLPRRARFYSKDRRSWPLLDPNLSHVTGSRLDSGTTGLWFDALEEVESRTLGLDSFRKHPNGDTLDRFHAHETAFIQDAFNKKL